MPGFFIGYSEGQIDSKNRIRIPSRFKVDGKRLVFTLAPDHKIWVFLEEDFQVIAKSMYDENKFSYSSKSAACTFILETSMQMDSDAQGRMTLLPMQKKYAKIDKNVVFSGGGNRIIISSKEAHDVSFEEGIEQLDTYHAELEKEQCQNFLISP